MALFAKAPVPGRVKTRLTPPLEPEQAASLYRAMLLDILDQHAKAAAGRDHALWYTPPEEAAWFRAHAPRDWLLRPQVGENLGRRMAALFRTHAEEGYRAIVLRGTDSPTLPLARADEAFDALERADLVICPDRDGGYNLIGLRAPCDPLFDRPMSHEDVLTETLATAGALGLRVELLESHYDVDTPADLERLARDATPETVPRTLRWLERDRGGAGVRASIDP